MKNNQKGFGAVEVLIIIVVVGLLGGGGYYVYNKHRTPKPTTSTNTSINQTTTTNNTYLEIKEWGVRITLPASLKGDVVYKPSAQFPDTNINLSRKSQVAIDANCAPAQNPSLGVLVRTKKGTYESEQDHSSTPAPFKTIGEYEYTWQNPQGTCLTKNDAETQQRLDAVTPIAETDAKFYESLEQY
jgi:Tfp pilus assembly protein PilX